MNARAKMLSHLWFICACRGWRRQLCAMRLAMRYLAVVAVVVLAATAAAAQAPAPTCKAQADQKTLAGAALKSLMGKCEKDAARACSTSATDKKLSGAAKSSHVKQCASDTVGQLMAPRR